MFQRGAIWLILLQLGSCAAMRISAVRHPAAMAISSEQAIGAATSLPATEPLPAYAPPFSFTRQWYPLFIAQDLDPTRPNKALLLGMPVVAWNDGKQWAAFNDFCPHRGAPLSEGRIDPATNMLQCMYHGYAFRGDGSCGAIPQAPEETAQAAMSSPRACAQALPVVERYGILWVWPDSSPEGRRAAVGKEPAVVPESEGPGYSGEWYQRDLPISYETVIENLGDPAHIPFAHHGIMSNRAFGKPLGLRLKPLGEKNAEVARKNTEEARKNTEEEQAERAEKARRFGENPVYLTDLFSIVPRLPPSTSVGFLPPSLIYYRTDFSGTPPMPAPRTKNPLKIAGATLQKLRNFNNKDGNGRKAGNGNGGGEGVGGDGKPPSQVAYLLAFVIPRTPGSSRLLLKLSANFPARGASRTRLEKHVAQHLVLDGDTPALHTLERLVHRRSNGDPTLKALDRVLYMPTDSDAPLRAFRKWLNDEAGGGVPMAAGTPNDLEHVETRRHVLLDRYESHVKNCATCSQALARLRRARNNSVAAAVAAVAAAAAASGPAAPLLAAASLAAAVGAFKLHKREARHIFVDYVHADKP